jgi:hypothetical protein
MNKETINCQVVMLPTKKSRLSNRNGELSFADVGGSYTGNHNPQHLYFTSNEEIKEGTLKVGEWVYNNLSGIGRVDSFNVDNKDLVIKYNNEPFIVEEDYKNVQRIIASTDPSLSLPAIPESFLKQYVAANGNIDKVKLQRVDVNFDEHIIGSGSPKPKYVLELTAANEIVVVEQSKLDKGYEKFLNNPEEYIEKTRNASEDKELEDAANLSAPGSLYGRFHFKAGAEWQKEQLQLLETSLKGRLHKIKEQSANDAIKFATWVMQQKFDYLVGKSYEKLYKLWQKTKDNADN